MNKKILLVLLLLIPMVIFAKCDEAKHEEYVKLAPNITYDNDYSKSSDTFSLIIYNIFDDMYVTSGQKKYKPDAENKVTVDNIKPGSNVMLDIYANDGCDQIKSITVLEPYFNPYYGSQDCLGYETKIPVCSAQFTSSVVTKSLVEEAKSNYDNVIHQVVEKEEVKEDNGIIKQVLDFLKNWGIKILLVVVTIFITSSLFGAKFRKIKHGI